MSSHLLNKQNAAILYRKWYVTGNKNPSSNYDKEQIDALTKFHLCENERFISSLRDSSDKVLRVTFQILFIKPNSIEIIPNEVLILGNEFYAINIPGCASFGNDFMGGVKNYFNAVIECLDARFKNNMKSMNLVSTMKFFDANSKDKTYEEIVTSIENNGWTKTYFGEYNDIFLKKGNKVSFTIPKVSIIPAGLAFWYNKHLFQISAKQEFEDERDMGFY